uniref:Uncharacterized protein n=1 Tax=Phaselicystis flava TaxID=525924 RepID=A0A3S7V083_9BACT|nr:hypothetical protein [Phaselicystis flava]
MNNPPGNYYCVVCYQLHTWATGCPKAQAQAGGDSKDAKSAAGGGSAAATASGGSAAAGGNAAAEWRRAAGSMGSKPMQFICPHCRQMHSADVICPKLRQTDFKAGADEKVAAALSMRWVFEHDPARMAAIEAAATKQGLAGMCSVWTCDWLRRKLMGETITENTYADLASIASMQKWFSVRVGQLEGTGLESPTVGAGIVSAGAPTCKGLIADLKVATPANRASYNHLSGAYYLALRGVNPQTHEQDRHAIGIYFGTGSWSSFDQNRGMFEVLGRAPHKFFLLKEALALYNLRLPWLEHWELFSVALSLKKQDDADKTATAAAAAAAAKPPLTRRKTF